MEGNMKVFLFGNQGYMSVIIQRLLDDNINVVGLCTRITKKRRAFALRQKLKDRCKNYFEIGNDNFLFKRPFEDCVDPARIAKKFDVPIFPSSAVHKNDFAEILTRLAPNVILCAGFHRLIPPRLTASASIAALNFHPSLLPKHRGGTPNRWVVKLGEDATGISVHYLADGFDTGGIVKKTRIAIDRNKATLGDVEIKILALMPDVVSEVLSVIRVGGGLNYIPQDESGASEEPSLKVKDREIDWTQSSEQILRTCFCMQPGSGGLSKINGKKICLWDVASGGDTASLQIPGQIINIEGDGSVVVSCGAGVLRISTFLSFGKIQPALIIARKHNIQKGDIFV